MDLAIAIIGAVATKANETSHTMAAIERDRRHDELTPDFDVTCTIRSTNADSADLHVAFEARSARAPR